MRYALCLTRPRVTWEYWDRSSPQSQQRHDFSITHDTRHTTHDARHTDRRVTSREAILIYHVPFRAEIEALDTRSTIDLKSAEHVAYEVWRTGVCERMSAWLMCITVIISLWFCRIYFKPESLKQIILMNGEMLGWTALSLYTRNRKRR